MNDLWMGNSAGISELEVVKGVQLTGMQTFPGYLKKLLYIA